MLLGLVVLVEVDAGSVVVLHGVTGQQLPEKEASLHSVNIPAPAPFYHYHFIFEVTLSQGAAAAARPLEGALRPG